VIRAAGAVLWRRGAHGPEVAVVHRPRYDDWSLPKGKLDHDEPWLLAAVREVREETGMLGVPGSSLGMTAYDAAGRPKTVRWWAMRAESGHFRPTEEVDELRWLSPSQARSVVRDAVPLRRWESLPSEASVVLLVRHGSAGDADRWSGSDDDRPLDALGLGQAERIAQVLSAYRPTRILSAPPLRCRDTIGPLAAALGVPVDVTAEVGEVGAPADPHRVVLGLAVPGESIVVCSQGGVLPRVVDALAPERAPARARKGSVWSLTVDRRRALVADDTILA
jgi:phosphohistidine phosphatase SixA/8-oxo-dGTP pyrophosphatase MutT (NUDIX family)